jgi:enediyne biosynthesis protein E4
MKFILAVAIAFVPLLSFAQGFTKLDAASSGITFINAVTEDEIINGMTWEYLYNGAGVSIGDFNQDGWEDIFFTSNQSANTLYLNNGDMSFTDATKKYIGKTQPEGFNTGSTVVDINNDGFPDIYVSRGGWHNEPEKRRNLLYVNEGGKKFTERAVEFGIADTSCTTQAAFFDADLDGDLDLYCVNYIRWRKKTQKIRTDQPEVLSGGEDSYYENRNGKFYLATQEAGLSENRSFGLGLAISDINSDGYPDIYVCNDYEEPDHLYINQRNGKFVDVIKVATNHISFYAMGVDIADINNDLMPDIYVLDMASEDHVRSKKNMPGMSSKAFWSAVNAGKHYQYMFNSLQLNMGNLQFSETAQLSGISKTDWSWAPLIADFDNDGWQDIFVTNGYKRDIRDNDYRRFVFNKVVGASEIVPLDDLLAPAPQVKVPNYIFKNNGDLTFSNKVLEWGISEPINANGAAYARW